MIDRLKKGIEANRSVALRAGNVINLPESGKVIITGDLHGHRRNFERVVSFADLQSNPQTFVIFQEILHGGPEDEQGGCLSFELFMDVVSYQLQFPNQVFLVMGNHDTAIIADNDVMKAGKEMNRALKAAMKNCLGDDYRNVMETMKDYLLSQPIAVRCPNRIWMSHSLPADRFVDTFDMAVFDKELAPADVLRLEPLYLLTWGRRQSARALEEFAGRLDVDAFIVGHQPQEKGWQFVEPNMIILASEHNHGCMITFDLDRRYTVDQLVDCIVPLASIT